MTDLEYLRPTTLAQALEYLREGIPLAGGTNLTPRRNNLTRVVDLRELGLDGIDRDGSQVRIGSATTLQDLVESPLLPDTLKKTSWLEGGWNLRNMATLGGLIMSSDGRSPLLTVLLALDTSIRIQPGDKESSLDDVLDQHDNVGLITEIRFRTPDHLMYEQVARTPVDFPLVCAAVAIDEDGDLPRVALGGHGSRPIRIEFSAADRDPSNVIDEAANVAQTQFRDAGDHWASAEYRSSIARVLVKRLLSESQPS
jgi:putative selenate reductase FAD-binding subunit